MKFYRCKKCGKAVAVLGESGEDMFCRNAEIEELIPNTTDAAGEKHVPVITKDGSKVHVAVGSVEHPCWKATISPGLFWKRRTEASRWI